MASVTLGTVSGVGLAAQKLLITWAYDERVVDACIGCGVIDSKHDAASHQFLESLGAGLDRVSRRPEQRRRKTAVGRARDLADDVAGVGTQNADLCARNQCTARIEKKLPLSGVEEKDLL